MAPSTPTDQVALDAPSHDIAAGASLGLLIGALVGFSVESTIGGVLTALVALLATALGLSSASRLSGRRLSAFCFAMLVATPFAITARTHDWLGAPREGVPSVKAAVSEWTDAGFSSDEARQIVRTARAKSAGDSAPAKKGATNDPSLGVLYSSGAGPCGDLSWGRSESVAARLSHMDSAGLPLDGLARFVRAQPEGSQASALQRLEEAFCRP